VQMSLATLRFLHWIVGDRGIRVARETLSCDSKDEWVQFVSKAVKDANQVPPNYIFRVSYDDAASALFESRAAEHGTMLAFHGSGMENWHSILHNGFSQKFAVRQAFGTGLYFSDDYKVAVEYAPQTAVRLLSSSLTGPVSCVAVCELINNPAKVKKGRQGAALALDGGGEPSVPEHYIVIADGAYVRVKALLVYATVPPPSNRPASRIGKFTSMVIVYVLLLAFVSASRSTWWKHLLQ